MRTKINRETQMKQNWFFEMIIKIDNLLTKLKMKTQITNMKNEVTAITTDPADIKRLIILEYCKQSTHIFDNLA